MLQSPASAGSQGTTVGPGHGAAESGLPLRLQFRGPSPPRPGDTHPRQPGSHGGPAGAPPPRRERGATKLRPGQPGSVGGRCCGNRYAVVRGSGPTPTTNCGAFRTGGDGDLSGRKLRLCRCTAISLLATMAWRQSRGTPGGGVGARTPHPIGGRATLDCCYTSVFLQPMADLQRRSMQPGV